MPIEMMHGPGSDRARAHKEWALIPAPDHICPRCEDPVPDAMHRGEYVGARSRTDTRTEICSRCGTEEAYEQMAGKLRPQSKWPMTEDAKRRRDERRPSWPEIRSAGRGAVTPMPMPKEVPDLRLYLLDKWSDDGPFTRALAARFRALEAGRSPEEQKKQIQAVLRHDVMAERVALQDASLWWVKAEMLDLVTAAGPAIPDDVRADELTFPAKQARGLCVFEHPWIGLDSDDESRTVRVDAICWTPGFAGTDTMILNLSMYRYMDFATGLDKDELQKAVQTGQIFEGQMRHSVLDATRLLSSLSGGYWAYLGRTSWPMENTAVSFDLLDERASEFLLIDKLTDARKKSMIEDRKFFAAFCSLVNHKLSDIDPIKLPHWRNKQIVRERPGATLEDLTKPINTIRIVRLREVRHNHEGEGEHRPGWKGYSHRFPVSGHWKWVRCGPKRVNRRLVFVPAYVKGPKTKPFIAKEKVNVWVR